MRYDHYLKTFNSFVMLSLSFILFNQLIIFDTKYTIIMTININIKVLKMNLQEIFHKDYDYTFLFDSIQRMNDLVFICLHFIRCFILSKYNSKKDIPVINLDLIRTSFIALSKESFGRKSKSILLEELNEFYNSHFVKILNSDLYQIKRDILQETNQENFNSDKKYHIWINTVKTNIIPNIKKDLYFDSEHYPNKFLKCMLFMNAHI